MARYLSIAAFAAWIGGGVNAHEFWIDPTRHVVAPGEEVSAQFRVGEEFEGSALSWLPQRSRRFETVLGDTVREVKARAGDRPALRATPEGEGLMVIVHATGDSLLTWREWDDFEAFVTHKDADWALEAHVARGLPREDFVEVYSRYAKALIALGDGRGADRETGLLTEITALQNPFTDDMSGGLDVRLTYDGAPRADSQVEVFEKDGEGAVRIFTLRTDDEGRATVPVISGRRYMLDAVVLREPGPDVDPARGAVWETLWANLTFAVP